MLDNNTNNEDLISNIYELNKKIIQTNDKILKYDINKLYNPLIEPTRRPARQELPVGEFHKMIDLPTR
jgi:hypothetical protein